MPKKRRPAARKMALPDWIQIASFYAGRPIESVEFRDDIGGYGRSSQDSGRIELNQQVQTGLQDLLKWSANPGTGGLGLAPLALATLIHESIHNRDFGTPNPSDSMSRGASGFYSSGNETQANALGPELVADALQRFFGIGIDTPASRAFQKAAKGLSGYAGAYAFPLPSAPFGLPSDFSMPSDLLG